ncbi:MAG TPA: DNA-directed RNA polymerase subunit beta' [Candidatus Paceibacterota bacterium]|nr:DNA-directed RNA polymerase subunit beta' [Candidatus Paceibacterota bacterium]
MPEPLTSMRIKLASPEDILGWSYGEVTKPETINYRTQKAEREGLFSEAIFGPTKDWECYCGKYKRVRYKGIICDRCGVEVTRAIVRRERMGHIKLASPVAHIWFLRAVPSKIASVLGISLPDLERVIYFASYIVTRVNDDLRTEAMKRIESEFKNRIKNAANDEEVESLKDLKDRERSNLKNLRRYQVLSELDYRDMSMKYGEVFEAGIGAEAIRRLLEQIDLEELAVAVEAAYHHEHNPLEARKISRRLKLARSMQKAGVRPEWMVLTILPVIPPALRPMVPLEGGRYATSDLNDLYRRVINRNNRLKHLLELKAPEVIVKNEKRMLQESVDALIDNSMRRGAATTAATTGNKRALKSLADMLKGKQGRFRQNLLGKRVDYSGRSVIVIGPKLSIGECGLPKRVALELFKPFVIGNLIRKGLAHTIKPASRLIEQELPEVWAALEEEIEGKLVLLNRAPTLHRLSVQAFKPILIEGKAIQLPALPTTAFNADFDGDQMAVHLPLTRQAQQEAHDLMLATHGILKPATGDPVAAPKQDMVFGCYYLTNAEPGGKGDGKTFSSFAEARLAYENGIIGLRSIIRAPFEPSVPVTVTSTMKDTVSEPGMIQTTVGRIIFNENIPAGYPFVNRLLNATDLKVLEGSILDEYGEEETIKYLDRIAATGFHYATQSGVSMSMGDIDPPSEKGNVIQDAEAVIDQNMRLYEEGMLTAYERKSKAIETWNAAKQTITGLIKKKLDPQSYVFMIIDSKSRGNWGTMDQMLGMRGIFAKPSGELIELPVKSSFSDGIQPLEYFISSHGQRKGLVDTALRTATAGYLTRRLVDAAQDIVVSEEDCKEKEGYIIHAEDSKHSGEPFSKRVRGRVVMEDVKGPDGDIIVKKGKLVSKDAARKIQDAGITAVRIASAITCASLDGVCRRCYGTDLSKNDLVRIGEAVGIIAAQAIGEPGTQLTMKTFHTGGVAGGADITMGLPRVEEIFEARPPQFKAIIAETDGVVTAVEDRGKQKAIIVEAREGGEAREYLVPPSTAVAVAPGDPVTRGDRLCEGHVDLKELYAATGDLGAVARYIIREVQAIYFPTGDTINDKHVELIVRQMFSRVRVGDPGDTELLAGDVVEKRKALRENVAVKDMGKTPASYDQLIMGITKVSLTTESFLSSASFQETAKVLIESSIAGKEDPLRGLKENVIIGRLIPAGTGLKEELENA